jgi:PHD/YefM family antitoxin component YafN of YafNO toxin-antitoxin module
MPAIIPIKDLKDTSKISAMVHDLQEPIFVTKNGYGDMVLMSMESYEQSIFQQELLEKLEEAEQDFAQGKTKDGFQSLDEVKAKYGL